MKQTILAAALALLATTASAGTITNGDFSDKLNGWTSSGSVVVSSQGGQNTAVLYALAAGAYTTLSQQITLGAGDVLTGFAQFYAGDYMPFNDEAFVALDGNRVFEANVATVGDLGTSGPVRITWRAQVAGSYLLSAGVMNVGDDGAESELHLWDFSIRQAVEVPEPATTMLMGLGLLGFGSLRRRRAS